MSLPHTPHPPHMSFSPWHVHAFTLCPSPHDAPRHLRTAKNPEKDTKGASFDALGVHSKMGRPRTLIFQGSTCPIWITA